MTALDWINGGWTTSPYAVTIPGIGLGIDQDHSNGFQCKDFVNAYGIFLEAPFTAGNAITLWTVPQPGWTKVASPQIGDVFVRNAVFNGVNYGDTGIVQEVTNSGVYVIQQNLEANLTQGSPPGRMFWAFTQLLGYLRKDSMPADQVYEELHKRDVQADTDRAQAAEDLTRNTQLLQAAIQAAKEQAAADTTALRVEVQALSAKVDQLIGKE